MTSEFEVDDVDESRDAGVEERRVAQQAEHLALVVLRLERFARPIVEDQPEPMHNAASKPLKGGRQPRE